MDPISDIRSILPISISFQVTACQNATFQKSGQFMSEYPLNNYSFKWNEFILTLTFD